MYTLISTPYTHVQLYDRMYVMTIYLPSQVSELSEPPCSEEFDTVNSDRFWQQVENEMLAKGLTKGIYTKLNF